MRKTLLFLSVSFVTLTNVKGQQNYIDDSLRSHNIRITSLEKDVFSKPSHSAIKIINTLMEIDTKTHNAMGEKDHLLVSRVGLNKFLAKKIGYFLTGEENPALHKNYLFLNSGEKELVYGHNWYRTRTDDRVVSVWTLGLKADMKDGFAELANKEGWAQNTGINLKYTVYFTGGIKYDNLKEWQEEKDKSLTAAGKQKCAMNTKRRLFLMEQIEKLKAESNDFEAIQQSYRNDGAEDLCATKEDLIKETSAEFYSELKKKYLEAYYDKEVELLEGKEAKNLVRIGWLSFTGFAPFSTTTYSIITDIDYLPTPKNTYLATGNLNLNYFVEDKDLGKFLFNLGAEGLVNNSAKNEDIDKYTLNQIRQLTTDSIYLNEKEGDYYYGAYQDFVTGKFSGQITYYFPISKKYKKFLSGDWGLSARYEYETDGIKNKMNLRFGLPFLLKGKDKDSPVNFEVQFKLNDIATWTDDSKKYSVGISVGLPFSSIIYKK